MLKREWSQQKLRQSIFSVPREERTVLILDDEPQCLDILIHYLEDLGYKWVSATNCQEAWDVLETRHNIVMALVDLNLPDEYGANLIREMKQDPILRDIHLITQTADNTQKTREMAIDAGVFYHLTKPFTEEQLSNVMRSALEQYENRCRLLASLWSDEGEVKLEPDNTEMPANLKERIRRCRCKFKTLDEVDKISHFLSKIYPEPERILIGIYELLLNAVEHGNLGIDSEMKTRLIMQNRWKQEIRRRLNDPFYRDRVASAECVVMDDKIVLTVEDMGEGFDYHYYLNLDLAKLTAPNGRGIAIARLNSFDSLEYSEGGRKVVAVSRVG